MSPSTPAAFISYSREDSEFALRLAQDLKSAGGHVWLDQLDIVPGHPWDNAIEDALSEAKLMLLILSASASKSNNVRNEISYALDEGKIIIPVLYQDCNVPLQLRRTQRIDFRADYTRGLSSLLAQLGVTQPDQEVLQSAADAEEQRQVAWQAREHEAERLREIEKQKADEAERQDAERAQAEAATRKAAADAEALHQRKLEENQKEEAERARYLEEQRQAREAEELRLQKLDEAKKEEAERARRLVEDAEVFRLGTAPRRILTTPVPQAPPPQAPPPQAPPPPKAPPQAPPRQVQQPKPEIPKPMPGVPKPMPGSPKPMPFAMPASALNAGPKSNVGRNLFIGVAVAGVLLLLLLVVLAIIGSSQTSQSKPVEPIPVAPVDPVRVAADTNASLCNSGDANACYKAGEAYHDHLFDFERAVIVDEKAVALNPTVGNSLDLLEADFTVSQFAEGIKLASQIPPASISAREKLDMTAFKMACFWGEGDARQAHWAGLLFKALTKGGSGSWEFAGTLHFLENSPAFEQGRSLWIALFTALGRGDFDGMSSDIEDLLPILAGAPTSTK